MFEDAVDVRYFLSCLAREVRRGTIEVHSFSILTTHYHVLIRSLKGELSAAMKRAGGRYSRHFNRRHRRDGTLVRGRFFSRRVRSLNYRRTLVRYIDANPVHARMAVRPSDYRFGSAASYVHGRVPPWLTTTWIEAEVVRSPESVDEDLTREYTGAGYIERFNRHLTLHAVEVVKRRLKTNETGPDDLDSLIAAAPPRVLAWMRRKARLADGERLGEPIVSQAAVDECIEGWPPTLDRVIKKGGGRPVASRDVVRVGLLRSVAQLRWDEVARAANLPMSTCRRHHQRHLRLLFHEPDYATAAASCTQRAIIATFG